MVVIEKNNKIRFCLEPRNLNRALKIEQFPLPTIEEIATRLSKSKVFTVLNCSRGFYQIPSDKKSSKLTTFNTPFGRYYYKRLPFANKPAPEICQRYMVEYFKKLNR